MSHAFTDFPPQVVDKSSNFTADKSPYVYVVTTTGGSVTATLPAVSASLDGLVLSFHLEATTYPNTLTIDGSGAETIDGATTLVLYVNQDLVTIVCDGDEWHTLVDKRISHAARMTRAAAQTISDITVTVCALDTEIYDVGGIADPTTNNRFDIRRSGNYDITAGWAVTSGADKEVWVGIKKNGSATLRKWGLQTSSVAVDPYPVEVNDCIDLVAGDYIELAVYHNQGSNQDTKTATAFLPRMSVTEIR